MALRRAETSNRSREKATPNTAAATASAIGDNKKIRMIINFVETGLYDAGSHL